MTLRREPRLCGLIIIGMICLFVANLAIKANGPVIRAIVRPDSNLDLSWYTLLGHTYRVEFKTNLNTTNWLSLPGDVTGICWDGFNGPRLLLLTNYAQRFFRVVDVTNTNSPPPGFQGVDGKWRFYYEFSVWLNPSYTNNIFITRDGFALQDGKVFDGRFNGDPPANHFLILSNLIADPRVDYAYPVYTDATFSMRVRISNSLIVKPYNPADNLDALFTAEHLGNVHYIALIGAYSVTALRKEDDPFVIAQHLENDPRIEYAEVDVAADPRSYPCP